MSTTDQESEAELRARIAELEREVHDLNWALGTYGYPTMATPEQQAEADAAHAAVLDRISKMKAAKSLHDLQATRIARFEAVCKEAEGALEMTRSLLVNVQGYEPHGPSVLVIDAALASLRREIGGV